MTITPIARSPNPPNPEATPRERGDAVAGLSLRADFEMRLEQARRGRLSGIAPRAEDSAAMLAPPSGLLNGSVGNAGGETDGVRGPGLSILEFAAALDRLQVPVPVPGAPAQWEFTLDASHAPLQSVRVSESAAGGWDVALHSALPSERPLLAARLDRLRSRLAGRGVPVAHLRVDESDA
jgi:hypothetical protein